MKIKKLILIGATSLTLVIAIVSTALALSKSQERPKTEPVTSQTSVVEKPEDILTSDIVSETEKIETTLPQTPDNIIDVENKADDDKTAVKTPAETTEKPVTTTSPPNPEIV